MTNQEAKPRGEMLISLVLRVPLIAVDPANPNTFHAVTLDGLPYEDWPNGKFVVSACGLAGLKLVDGGDGQSVEWPPNVRSLGGSITRCRSCFNATPKKRPRSEFQRHVRSEP